MSERELIARYIEEHPRYPGPEHALLMESGVPVWALIAHLQLAAGGDVDLTAADYQVPPEAVRAALAYYHQHRAVLDARILLNSA